MNFIICTIILLAPHVVGKGTIANGDACSTDDDCYSYCCNNNNNYSGVQGICVPYKEDHRCAKRQKRDHLALYGMVAAFIAIVGVCGWIKHA